MQPLTQSSMEREDRQLNGYALELHTTRTGLCKIYRADWWVWDGKLVAMNARPVLRATSREKARVWCQKYSESNPGCMTMAQAKVAMAKS